MATKQQLLDQITNSEVFYLGGMRESISKKLISDIINLATAESNSITVTKTAADALVAGNLVQIGTLYKITGVHPTLYNDGTTSGTTVFVVGLDTNKFSEAGAGIFYNPIYTGTNLGMWSSYSQATAAVPTGVFKPGETITADNGAIGTMVVGFSNNKIFFTVTSGNWAAAASITGGTSGATTTISAAVIRSYAIGAKVNYGGYVWSNVNGNVGAATSVLALNAEWTKIAYNTTDYAIAFDPIVVDWANNLIISRTDLFNNTVKHDPADITYFAGKGLAGTPISVFRWGSSVSHGNTVNGSYLDNVSNFGIHENNNLSGQAIIAGNFMTVDANISRNNLYSKSEIRNNTLVEVVFIYYNNLFGGSTMNSNVLYNSATMYSNFLEDASTMNSNQVRGAEFYQNVLRYISNINSNISNAKWGYITKNNLLASTINSNTLNGLYTTAVGSDQAFINNNVLNYGNINSNILTVVFNGRRVYICNNFLQGDNNQDVPIRYSMIVGCTITGSGNTYIRMNTLKIAQILNANINGIGTDLIDNVVDDYVWDFATVANTGVFRGALLKADGIRVSFKKTFDGTANNGGIGTVSIPLLQVPAGFFVKEVLVDVAGGLTGSGAVLNFGLATDAPTAGLDNTSGAIATLNSAVVTKVSPTTFTKATATRLLTLSVATAAITAGTIGIVIKLSKLN